MDKKVNDIYTHVLIAKCSRDEALSIASLSPKERKRILMRAAFDKVNYIVAQRERGEPPKQG